MPDGGVELFKTYTASFKFRVNEDVESGEELSITSFLRMATTDSVILSL